MVTPESVINDCVINVATVNGSGSQSSNSIILRTLFRMGIPVGGKNLFPSNIAGLPTWFTIRANKDGYTARRVANDVTIAMNADTVSEDIRDVLPGGYFIYNSDLKFDTAILRKDVTNIPIPFRSLVDQATDQAKIKPLLTNMVYVGVIGHLMNLDFELLKEVVADQFGPKKVSVVEVNLKAIEVGRKFAQENIPGAFRFKAQPMKANDGKILIDGNTAGALGLVFGGCSFMAWYPITPSSSLAEAFISYAEKYRKDSQGKNTFGVVRAEDELASIGMVLGAGWAGCRALTPTSGPGISLMSEIAGYSYYAEIPAVIWDVQRVGPSTGLPTRTAQGDVMKAHVLSHGDTKHPVLLPGNVEECFEFGQTCFDLAERIQSLVLVLVDLDIGMNLWTGKEFTYPTKAMDRGKVLDEEGLKKMTGWGRYKDMDGDGIAYRTLPGTKHPAASYFTRGSGHNEKAAYTEKPDEYEQIMIRLARKMETAKKYVPAPLVDETAKSKVGIIAYGSTDFAIPEARAFLNSQGVKTDYLRLRALPFTDSVEKFVASHERVYVVEQNRDAQMKSLLLMDYPHLSTKFQSVIHFDGLPIDAKFISDSILKKERS